MGFRYKKITRKKQAPSVDIKQDSATIEEGYTGEIDGKPAAQGEENCLRASYRTGQVKTHWFRMPLGAPTGMPGQKELDFLFELNNGEFFAAQIRDYDFVHKGKEQEAKDIATDSFILQQLKEEYGISVIGNKINTISDDDLETSDKAFKTMEGLLLW